MSSPAEFPLEVTCQTVQAKLQANHPFLLLDCREASEHQLVNIAPAMLLPMSEIQQRLAELEPYRDQEIIVHCHHGGRSMRVTQFLRQQGFRQVSNMAGGIDQWAVEIDTSLARY